MKLFKQGLIDSDENPFSQEDQTFNQREEDVKLVNSNMYYLKIIPRMKTADYFNAKMDESINTLSIRYFI